MRGPDMNTEKQTLNLITLEFLNLTRKIAKFRKIGTFEQISASNFSVLKIFHMRK